MEAGIALLVGVFVAAGAYLLLSRAVVRILLGFVLLGNGINLLILTSGRLSRDAPPIIPAGLDVPLEPIVNPLPQALILTAIVIGFSMFAFLLVLSYRAYRTLDADSTDAMRLAEPKGGPTPPLTY
jgi:multicomponent Na+:H+ antiporter subunit C